MRRWHTVRSSVSGDDTYHHHYPPQETHSLGGPGQVPDGQGSAGSLALSEGHDTVMGLGSREEVMGMKSFWEARVLGRDQGLVLLSIFKDMHFHYFQEE